jgi:hypothetical protein
LALLGLVLAASVWPIFIGRGLTPSDGIFRLPPWRTESLRPASNPMLSDQYLTFQPVKHFVHEAWTHGSLGLWNPHLNCGMPSVGSMQFAQFYPLNLLLVWLNPFYAAGLGALLKLWIAGGFAYLYARRLGASSTGGALAGLAYALSGYMTVWLGHPHANAACLLPGLLWALDAERWLVLALLHGAMILGGHPPSAVLLTIVLAGYGWGLKRDKKREWGTALALGFGVSAVQLLPFVEYYLHSSLHHSGSAMDRWEYHLPLRTAIHYVLPLISGSPARRFETLGFAFGIDKGRFDNFNERAGYVGLATLVLALAAAWHLRKEKPVRALSIGAGLCMFFIWGHAAPILEHVPIVNHVNPTRLLVVLDLILAVLAALALDRLGELRRGVWLGVLWAIAGGALLWAWIAFLPFWPDFTPQEQAFALLQCAILVSAASAAGLGFWNAEKKWAKPLILASVLGELIYYGAGFNPSVKKEDYYPETPAIQKLQADFDPARFFALGWVLPPNTGVLYGLYDTRGQDYSTVRRYEELISGKAGEFFFYNTPTEIPGAFPLLGARYVLCERACPELTGYTKVHEGDATIYKKEDVPRAFVTSTYQVATPEWILARARLPGFEPRKVALLEETPGIAPTEGKAAEARFVSYAPGEVVLEAQASAPAVLVLLDTYFPGWKAWVDGKPVPILRADYAFRAVAVPAGKSVVRFKYQPISFTMGVLITLASAAYAWVLWRKR